MIQVFYWPREQRLIISGHAEKKGNWSPVVCGAASALFYAACTSSNGFLKRGIVKGRYYKDLKGLGYLKMWPKRRFFKRTLASIGTAVAGLLMLEGKYKSLIHVEVCTGIEFDDEKAITEAEQGGVSYLQKFVYDMSKDRPLTAAEAVKNAVNRSKRAEGGKK